MKKAAQERSYYEQRGKGGTYTEIDGIFYPDVTLDDEMAVQNDFCGKYGDMWKKHMHDNRNSDYRHYMFTGRLNMLNPDHVAINKVLSELDMGIFKSKNQFFIDAATYYIENYGRETLTKPKNNLVLYTKA